MKFSIKDFCIKYDQIRSSLRIWSYLLKKSLMANFIFCAVTSINTILLCKILDPWRESPRKYLLACRFVCWVICCFVYLFFRLSRVFSRNRWRHFLVSCVAFFAWPLNCKFFWLVCTYFKKCDGAWFCEKNLCVIFFTWIFCEKLAHVVFLIFLYEAISNILKIDFLGKIFFKVFRQKRSQNESKWSFSSFMETWCVILTWFFHKIAVADILKIDNIFDNSLDCFLLKEVI